MKLVKATWDLQLIILEYVGACPDFVHDPPPGPDPGSGMPGQSLAGFPRTLALRGDPNPKPAGCGWVEPVVSDPEVSPAGLGCRPDREQARETTLLIGTFTARRRAGPFGVTGAPTR